MEFGFDIRMANAWPEGSERQIHFTSVVTLTFLSVWPRVLRRNVRVKATLETYGC
jgi:hypothetical protein